MQAKVFTSLKDPLLADVLADGAIGIIPTDTVYGLVGCAANRKAVERLYTIKKRVRQPGTTIAAAVEDLANLGFPYSALQAAKPHWPAPLSVEMPTDTIADYLKVNQPVMAARIPDHSELTKLLTKTGPLMTTSANAPGQPTATNIKTAMQYFGDSVDFYVDAGELGERPPSTIVGFDHNGQVIIYRQGAVTL